MARAAEGAQRPHGSRRRASSEPRSPGKHTKLHRVIGKSNPAETKDGAAAWAAAVDKSKVEVPVPVPVTPGR